MYLYKQLRVQNLIFTLLVSLLFFAVTDLHGQIQLLNDEFDDAISISDWSNVNSTEGWNASHLEAYDINNTYPGKLYMLPWTTAWYQERRSTLLFKMVTGDFVFSTRVSASNRMGSSFPGSNFSLAGPMIRTAKNFSNGAAGWQPNEENYVFLSIGRASGGGNAPHFEVKSTTNSSSNLQITPINNYLDTEIRLARINGYVICLYRLPGGDWTINNRYDRSDMPSSVQVGLVAYTDWDKVNTYAPTFANANTINANLNPDPSSNPNQAFNPDLVATFDYARFDSITLPSALQGLDLSNPSIVSNADLLSLLSFPSQPYLPNNVHFGANATGIEVFPNPINEYINIIGELNNYTIEVIDINGNVLNTYINLFDRLTIDSSELPAGMHFIIISSDINSDIIVQKIITE